MVGTKEANENLTVDKAKFDAALKKLIASPPIRKAAIRKGHPWRLKTDHREPYLPKR